jgi:hypothetical protein
MALKRRNDLKKQIVSRHNRLAITISNKRQTNNYQQSAAIENAEGDDILSSDRIKQILVMQFWMKN